MHAVHQYAIIHLCRNSWVFYLMAAVFNFSLFPVYHNINGHFMLFGQMIIIYPCLCWLICDFMRYDQGCKPSSCDFMSYDKGCKPSSLEIATLEGFLLA